MGNLSNINEEKRGLVKEIHRLSNLGIHVLDYENRGVIVQEGVKSCLNDKVK